mgnify:CR=1 FL=1
MSDLSPLAGLDNLAELRLAYNQVQSVLPLAGLGKLEFLELRKNRVMDVSPLQGMESLKRVSAQPGVRGGFTPCASGEPGPVLKLNDKSARACRFWLNEPVACVPIQLCYFLLCRCSSSQPTGNAASVVRGSPANENSSTASSVTRRLVLLLLFDSLGFTEHAIMRKNQVMIWRER